MLESIKIYKNINIIKETLIDNKGSIILSLFVLFIIFIGYIYYKNFAVLKDPKNIKNIILSYGSYGIIVFLIFQIIQVVAFYTRRSNANSWRIYIRNFARKCIFSYRDYFRKCFCIFISSYIW